MKRLLVVFAACGGHPLAPLSLTTTPALDHARVDQLVELGDAVFVFEPDKIEIVRNGTVVVSAPVDHSPCLGGAPPRSIAMECLWPVGKSWSSATSIPALDGDGRWVVATRHGALLRVLASGELESIGHRFGLQEGTIRSIAAFGTTIAVQTDTSIIVTTDGLHVNRYEGEGELAVGRDRLAVAGDHAIELWDLKRKTRSSFAIDHAHPSFAGSDMTQLIATTSNAVWIERDGKLARLDVPTGELSAVAAGPRVWVRAGAQIYAYERGRLVKTSVELARATTLAVLVGSPSGDLWIDMVGVSDGGFFGAQLRRESFARGSTDPAWTARVQPVFERVCAHCHLPGGSADVDLSTAAAWTAERDEIVRRVVVTRTMPPAGTTLSDDDRDALAGWLKAR